MTRAILLGAAMALAASTAAFAQTPSGTAPGYPDVKVIPVDAAKPAAQGEGLRKTLAGDLQKAGYTDVTIVPEAFIVQAKNKAGDPVTMFLSPDSMTVFTATDAKGKDAKTAAADPAKPAAPAKN